jgi:hypothetical protein
MQLSPQTEWSKLYDVIVDELQRTSMSDFERAWQSCEAKTDFYGRFFQAVAERLGYLPWTEFLRCDFVIANREGIPVAFIESENMHGSATDEVEKLCAVAAPVKILLLSCEWSDSERDILSPRWRERIALQHSYFGVECIYVFMVGEWGRGRPDDGILRYLFDVIDHHGVELYRREIILPNTAPEPTQTAPLSLHTLSKPAP